MTEKEILEYNRRCAEFLGITTGYFKSEIDCVNHEYQWMCVRANCTYEFQKDDYPLLDVWDYLEFHSDWNWIMEVVEAIESFKTTTSTFKFVIDVKTVTIVERLNYSFREGDGGKTTRFLKINGTSAWLTKETKKEAIVEAINQFLIWYNNK